MAHIGTLEVEHESIVVVYDPDTGDIAHFHQTLTTKGGKHPDEKAIEKEALEQFAHLQPRVKKKMAVLKMEPGRLERRRSLKVDVKKRVVVDQ